MKKILIMAVAAIMATMSAQAQKLQTVDKKGQPVPYASVLTEDGNFVGVTDLNGILDDVKGAKTVSISHVAYKTKTVNVGQGSVVTLEDSDFDLPEITVSKKPLVYVQTYYRILCMSVDDDMPVTYFRAGVLDNAYDIQKKDVSADEDHFSACNMGLAKTILNAFLNPFIKRLAALKVDNMETRIKKGYDGIDIDFVPNGPGKQNIVDQFGLVGTVTDDEGERRYSCDTHLMRNHEIQATGNDKKIAKAEKKDNKKKDRKDQTFFVFRIDEDGKYAPEDFVMSQNYETYTDAKDGHVMHILMQVYSAERAYVTKEELKQMKKDNKMKMTYENIVEYERTHHIPPLSDVFQKSIQEIVK